MDYADRFLQLSQGERILFLMYAFIITVAVYSIIPVLFAIFTKKRITKKGYSIFCYVFNLLFLILDTIQSGGVLQLAPYLIWTPTAIWIGLKILKKRGKFNPY